MSPSGPVALRLQGLSTSTHHGGTILLVVDSLATQPTLLIVHQSHSEPSGLLNWPKLSLQGLMLAGNYIMEAHITCSARAALQGRMAQEGMTSALQVSLEVDIMFCL